jgi:uncharacterized protein YbbC (DUF1343 family)
MKKFLYGIDVLVRTHRDKLSKARVGLVAHPASVNMEGIPTPVFLRQSGINLVCLMGPEHGFMGKGGAGEEIGHQRHPEWDIPVYSLYGDTRKPTPEMLADLDYIIFDLQDLGVRAYTYVSTLRYVLETAAEQSKQVIVADRPIPLPNVVDGPMREDSFESFVGFIRTPVAYGLTPGEAALWMKAELHLDVPITVAPMAGYQRNIAWPAADSWIPPSPAIRSLACAQCFPVTVFFEALPSVDHARRSEEAFQCIGAPWIDGEELSRSLNHLRLPGVRFERHSYQAVGGAHDGHLLNGVRIEVLDPFAFKPVTTGMAVIHTLQALHGLEPLWQAPGVREDFFDKLMGTNSVRLALKAGESWTSIGRSWESSRQAYLGSRSDILLYV